MYNDFCIIDDTYNVAVSRRLSRELAFQRGNSKGDCLFQMNKRLPMRKVLL